MFAIVNIILYTGKKERVGNDEDSIPADELLGTVVYCIIHDMFAGALVEFFFQVAVPVYTRLALLMMILYKLPPI